jgi:hypothetical protein
MENKMRVLFGLILIIVGCIIGFVGYQYDETVRTEIVSKSQITTKELIGSQTKYYYTTTDNIQHEVTAQKYIVIPEKGIWTHESPTHTGTIIMVIGGVIAMVGLVIISPDMAIILVILEGCS